MTSKPFFYLLEKLTNLIFPLNLKKPYSIMYAGILGDFISTKIDLYIGKPFGFYESHPAYSPINALVLFLSVLTIVRFATRNSKYQIPIMTVFSCLFLYGLINNIVVALYWFI